MTPGRSGARRTGHALCVLVAAWLTASAGDERVLARDDLDFVRALVRSGYPDLADELLTNFETSKHPSAQDVLHAQALRLELAEFAAREEPDPELQGKKLQTVVDSMERFVKEHPGTRAAEDLSDRLLDIYRAFGERVAALLASEDTAAQAQKLRGMGESMFERALSTLKSERETLAKKLEAQDPDNPDFELQRRAMLAAYNLARTYYFHAQLLQDQTLKQARLKSALAVLADIQLDYSDQLLCYEGYIYEGLCRRDLGQPDQAIDSFDYAISLRDTYEKGANGLYAMDPEAVDIVSSAVLQKMLLLIQKGDAKGAVDAARDFFATVAGAGTSLKGLAILGQQAEALRTLGDQKGLEATAQRMIELDPNGPGGERARELMGSASATSLGGADTSKLAKAAAQRGDAERAIRLFQQVLILVRDTPDEANLGAEASLWLGSVFAQRGWLHEAVVVWSDVTLRYAKGKDAPECLWKAANGYLSLQDQERNAFYRDGAREVMARLASNYPKHEYASMAAIIEGRQLESAGEFKKAAEVYEHVPAGSAGHEEALYRAGDAWSREARKLAGEGQGSAASDAAARAEELLKNSRTALEAAATKTLDLGAQERLRGLSFNARVSLANLYLVKGVNKETAIPPLFEGVEREFPGDGSKLATARALRLRALQAMGKIDEAAAQLDAQLREDPSGRGLGSSAAAIARAFDERGGARRAASSSEADAAWRKAAGYYVIAVRGQVEGEEAVRVDELEPIANRLFALALHFNGVPEDVDSFVDWKGPRPDEALFEQAYRAYEAVLPLTPSYRTRISLARTLGFLQRWEEAASSYANLFEREQFANLTSRTIDPEAMRAKPELAAAFLEWGVCEREVGIADKNSDRLARASAIFEALVVGTRSGSQLWWQAKFQQIQSLADRGEYDIAGIAMRDMERNWPEFDGGEYKLKERFQRLGQELARKVSKQ